MTVVDHAALIADLPRLLRIARGLGLSHHDAEDLVQAAVVRVLPRWESIGADPHPYLRRVLTHLFIDRVRRTAVVTEQAIGLFADDERVAGHDNTEGLALRIDVERALAVLTPFTRTVLVLRFLDGQTIAATAAILQRPEGTIARITSEGLVALRRTDVFTSTPGRRSDD